MTAILVVAMSAISSVLIGWYGVDFVVQVSGLSDHSHGILHTVVICVTFFAGIGFWLGLRSAVEEKRMELMDMEEDFPNLPTILRSSLEAWRLK